MSLEIKLPSPLQRLPWPTADMECYVKRDDLIHPFISGNKWRKLSCNIDDFQKNGHSAILSFGGAYSNHLYALAAVGKALQIRTIGIVRGLEADLNNPTLSFCRACGMEVIPVSRSEYKAKENGSTTLEYRSTEDILCIPEGGNNALGARGCETIISEIEEQLGTSTFTLALAVGTGTTAKGILKKSKADTSILLYQASQDPITFEGAADATRISTFIFRNKYRRFGKMDADLGRYINELYERTQIWFEPLYTAKMMLELEQQIVQADVLAKKPLVILHTGGLQGIAGYNERFGKGEARIAYEGPSITYC